MDTRDKGIRTIAPRQTLASSHPYLQRESFNITGGVGILLLLLLGPQLVDTAVSIGKMSNM